MRIAYTLGRTTSYDKALAEEPIVHKLGAQPIDGWPKGYPGGWVWSSKKAALEFLAGPFEALTNWKPQEFSVYIVELPGPWETTVSPLPGEDGVHHLLQDAKIWCKLEDFEANISFIQPFLKTLQQAPLTVRVGLRH